MLGISQPKEKGTQLYFRDDGSYIFRKLDIEDGWLIEKDNTGKPTRAFMMFYKLRKKFDGRKGVAADIVTLSYNRDVLFDPFGQLLSEEKPEKGAELKKKFMTKLADAKCYRHEQDARPSGYYDRMVVFMGIVAVLLAIAIGVKAAF